MGLLLAAGPNSARRIKSASGCLRQFLQELNLMHYTGGQVQNIIPSMPAPGYTAPAEFSAAQMQTLSSQLQPNQVCEPNPSAQSTILALICLEQCIVHAL